HPVPARRPPVVRIRAPTAGKAEQVRALVVLSRRMLPRVRLLELQRLGGPAVPHITPMPYLHISSHPSMIAAEAADGASHGYRVCSCWRASGAALCRMCEQPDLLGTDERGATRQRQS